MCDIYSNLTIKALERCHWHWSGALVLLWCETHCSGVFIVDFEQVNLSCISRGVFRTKLKIELFCENSWRLKVVIFFPKKTLHMFDWVFIICSNSNPRNIPLSMIKWKLRKGLSSVSGGGTAHMISSVKIFQNISIKIFLNFLGGFVFVHLFLFLNI